MLRGCQRRVIHIKNTQSHLFDEAYFIICEQSESKEEKEKDMLKEARHIIARLLPEEEREKRAKRKVLLLFLASFSLGVLCASLSFLLLL